MPRRKKKYSTLQQRNQQELSMKNTDFTVYDYTRTNKPSSWHTEVKQLTGPSAVQKSEIEALPDDWSENTGEDGTQLSSQEPPTTACSQVHRNLKSASCKKRNLSDDSGYVYPVDLWHVIGDYVQPEDIAVFARICHGTHVVVHSARFWLSIYRRFCQSMSEPTSILSQPEYSRQQVHGLRTRVIRALFNVYPPLSCRTSHRVNATTPGCTPAPSPVDPDSLVGLRCVVAWYERFNKQQWRFCFRFERGSSPASKRVVGCHLSPQRGGDESNYLLAPDDVMYNVDERSVVLVAVTPHFVSLPAVMGQVLVKSSVTNDGMFARRLRLVFCSEYMHVGRAVPSGALSVEIDTLQSLCISHWWDPSFPYRR